MIRTIALKIAQQLILFSIDAGLRKLLPRIFFSLDREIPYWLSKGAGPSQISTVLTNAVDDVLGRPSTPAEQAIVRLLFDPIQAAQANLPQSK